MPYPLRPSSRQIPTPLFDRRTHRGRRKDLTQDPWPGPARHPELPASAQVQAMPRSRRSRFQRSRKPTVQCVRPVPLAMQGRPEKPSRPPNPPNEHQRTKPPLSTHPSNCSERDFRRQHSPSAETSRQRLESHCGLKQTPPVQCSRHRQKGAPGLPKPPTHNSVCLHPQKRDQTQTSVPFKGHVCRP